MACGDVTRNPPDNAPNDSAPKQGGSGGSGTDGTASGSAGSGATTATTLGTVGGTSTTGECTVAATGEAVVSPVARKRIVRLTTDQVLRSLGALVDGAEQLAADLTMNDTFATCLARHFLAYALSEPPEDGVDACAVQDIMQAFASSSRQLPDLIRAVAVSKAFTERLGAQ